MKKIISTFLMMAVMLIMLPFAASAQTYVKRYYKNGRWHTVRTTRKPSFYRRHRNASNVAIGTGAGAVIGAIAGGGKGALIGSAIGAGGSSLYTYKIKPKKRKYRRVRRY